MQELKDIVLPNYPIVLPNYPLVLSLLKHRHVWVFWNKKKSGSNKCPLNSSIEKNRGYGRMTGLDDMQLVSSTHQRTYKKFIDD